MDKDEALKLAFALDYWATQTDMGRKPDPKSLIRRASAELRRLQAELDAVKQALAAQPVQERTDYEVHLNHCNIGECEGVCKYGDDDCPALEHADMKAKWDRPTPPAQPAPVEPVACVACEGNPKWGNIPCTVCGTTPPAAQPAPVQPVAWMDKYGEIYKDVPEVLSTDTPLYATPLAAAVPDAMTSADIQEHIEYVAGWNDCRQAMLEMMK